MVEVSTGEKGKENQYEQDIVYVCEKEGWKQNGEVAGSRVGECR